MIDSEKTIYKEQFEFLKNNLLENTEVFEDYVNQSGAHPEGYRNFECGFASKVIRRLQPNKILDIGTNRLFIAGLSSKTKIDSIDVRKREMPFVEETTIIADSINLSTIEDESYDFILSLNAIEHFGLGRYGDEFNINADVAAFSEWKRILKKNGKIVFSTTITRYKPSIAFNAHRIYTHGQIIEKFSDGMNIDMEEYFSNDFNKIVSASEICNTSRKWDIYAGCWSKL